MRIDDDEGDDCQCEKLKVEKVNNVSLRIIFSSDEEGSSGREIDKWKIRV